MLLATLLSWFSVGLFIRISRMYGWGQPVRKDGPQTHLVKDGIPTAGGIPFVLVMCCVFFPMYLTGHGGDQRELVIMFAAIGMGIVGGIDDILKIRSRMTGSGKRELIAREKLPLQVLVSFIFAWFAAPFATHELVPSLGGIGGVPIWDILLITFVMIASVNAFNFTDGVDGLLGGIGIIVLLPLLALSPTAALMVAVLLGYMWFNAHPAKVFMGDMGSHAIGAVAAGVWIMYADVWFFPIVALIPVVEVISVILQVSYFKRTGKRIFKMTPIHHHFEKSGWSESQVGIRFWAITAAMSALAWWILGGRP